MFFSGNAHDGRHAGRQSRRDKIGGRKTLPLALIVDRRIRFELPA